jgi:hypothetical protein
MSPTLGPKSTEADAFLSEPAGLLSLLPLLEKFREKPRVPEQKRQGAARVA